MKGIGIGRNTDVSRQRPDLPPVDRLPTLTDRRERHEFAGDPSEALRGRWFERVVDPGRPSFRSYPTRLSQHPEVVRDRRLVHVAAVEIACGDRAFEL